MNCWQVWANGSLFLVVAERSVMQLWKLATLLLTNRFQMLLEIWSQVKHKVESFYRYYRCCSTCHIHLWCWWAFDYHWGVPWGGARLQEQVKQGVIQRLIYPDQNRVFWKNNLLSPIWKMLNIVYGWFINCYIFQNLLTKYGKNDSGDILLKLHRFFFWLSRLYFLTLHKKEKFELVVIYRLLCNG